MRCSHMVVALAALAGRDVEFEVGGASQHARHGLGRLGGQQRAAEIGMQHRAGEVEDATQRGRKEVFERTGRHGDESGFVGRLVRHPRCGERVADRLHRRLAPVGFGEQERLRTPQQAIDRRQAAGSSGLDVHA